MLATKAQFRSSASLQDWDSNFDRGISKAKLKELAQLGFFQSKENLILIGPTGTGKTHLAISLGRRLCQEGMRTQFFSMNLFFEEVLAEKLAGKYLSFIRKLNRTPVLIWDDFGLRNYTHEEANLLIDIVEERYLKGSIIITSQVDPKGWSKLFEDPVIVEALLNRLLHPSKQIVLTGGSYREQLNKKPN
jgi:DNA replication protein DnaC